MYDTSRLEALSKRRAKILGQLDEVETEIKAELAAARQAEKAERPSEERLGGIVGVTRLTIGKWASEGRALPARETAE